MKSNNEKYKGVNPNFDFFSFLVQPVNTIAHNWNSQWVIYFVEESEDSNVEGREAQSFLIFKPYAHTISGKYLHLRNIFLTGFFGEKTKTLKHERES